MTELPDNILHLPQYQVLGCKSTDDEMHFQVDVPVTNAYTESINRLAKDKNREGRGYSFEVMRARMLTPRSTRRRHRLRRSLLSTRKPSVTDCRTSQRNSTTESIYQTSECGIRLMG